MSSTGTSPPPRGDGGTPHAQPPIRWPHPDRATVIVTVAWLLGLVIGLVIPAMIVPPSRNTAPIGQAWSAFGFTVLGAALMIIAVTVQWRRTGEAGALVLGAIPAFTLVVGGVIFTTAKIYGGL